MRRQTLSTTTVTRMRGNDLPPIVIDYLRRLRSLPVGAWAQAAAALDEAERRARAKPGSDSIAAAHASLRRIVSGMPGLAVQTQRRVQNLVEVAQTCLHSADCAMLKRAALAAALALMARPALGERLFTQLYAPFEPWIPLQELEAEREAAFEGAVPA